jgi:hypothetical protein
MWGKAWQKSQAHHKHFSLGTFKYIVDVDIKFFWQNR